MNEFLIRLQLKNKKDGGGRQRGSGDLDEFLIISKLTTIEKEEEAAREDVNEFLMNFELKSKRDGGGGHQRGF